jgi:uncharacterized protein YggU (UPF0235/DUF167 family)
LSIPSSPDDPFSPAAGGTRLAVRLTPKAAQNRIDGTALDAEGSAMLKVAVTAVPENGKANAALIALLAKAWKLPKSAIAITAGTTDRRKVLFIDADAALLRQRLAESTRSR